MSYASGILFALIVILTIGNKYATGRTERAIEIYKFFLYTLVGAWLGVTVSMIYVTYFTTIEVTLIQKELKLPLPQLNQKNFI